MMIRCAKKNGKADWLTAYPLSRLNACCDFLELASRRVLRMQEMVGFFAKGLAQKFFVNLLY